MLGGCVDLCDVDMLSRISVLLFLHMGNGKIGEHMVTWVTITHVIM
jgi:hypothetical protein